MKIHRVLVVDDEKLVCWSLAKMLAEAGYEVETASNGADALSLFYAYNPDMVLLDIRLPDANGMDLLQQFKAEDDDLIVVMITAYADADSAVGALKLGADDFIGKPFDLEKIRHIVAKAFEKKRLEEEVDYFRQELRRKYDYDNLVGNSPKMIQVFKMIKVCGETDAKTVLVLGESGTGKELVARSIHYHSARSDAPFIEVNCAAIPENLLENELFGHEKGAFTDASSRHKGIFEAAEGGSVFLDEIGDMPFTMQAKILKVIDNKRYRRLGGNRDVESDVRIIAATNQDLPELVSEGKFRADLFFRLNVMTISLPPLRERKEDIPSLVEYFIERLNEEYGRAVEGVSPETLEYLKRYDWPGNVRELRNTIERLMMLDQDKILGTTFLSPYVKKTGGTIGSAYHEPSGSRSRIQRDEIVLPANGISMEEVERQLIEQALARFEGNQTKAAECLRMSRDTLRYRMKKFGLLKKREDSVTENQRLSA